ncbi:MAG TPA: hypothetical protein VFP87_08485 [Chitinophagaceae bacterium]|nr:hypothetical protein [Chitinophagaceae bacterium]
MKRVSTALLFSFLLQCPAVDGQNAVLMKKVDHVQFFKDTAVLNATITTNISRIMRLKQKEGAQFPAFFSTTLADGSMVKDSILLEVRGHFRRDYCYLPPIRVIFKNNPYAIMKPLGSLKLVSQCRTFSENKQYLLKEFIIYKIYNLLTDMSFRVRLLNLNWQDTVNKSKSLSEYAFLLEDTKDLAERNNCFESKRVKIKTEATDRKQMTLVAIFEYMIGNTDWAVPADHNAKLITPKADSSQRPYVVPYDFDYSGFVNADYAVPDQNLPIQSGRERLYRGFPRSMEELNDVIVIFNERKKAIYDVVNGFNLLTARSKKEVIDYLDEFYSIISDPQQVRQIFILNARTE